MIISNTHRAIFVHVPKTAGTSMTALIDPHLGWNDLVLGGSEFGERLNLAYRDRFGLHKHMWARDIRRVVGADLWSRYFTFAFVRHPYLRLASYYRWIEGTAGRAGPDAPFWTWPATKAFLGTSSFSEFLRDSRFVEARSGRPQADWVCDEDGRCIVDFVGRFEALEDGVRTVAARLGIEGSDLERRNPSPASGSSADLFRDEADYDWIHRIHRQDFELFGYDPSLRL
jgi:hypothetical protein